MKNKWVNDKEYRKKATEASKAKWENPDFVERQQSGASKSLKRRWQKDPEGMRKMLLKANPSRSKSSAEMWKKPEYREKMAPHVGKWTKPEKTVRGWLQRMELYKTGSKTKNKIGFLPHKWLPTKGSGFTSNANFVDYNHKLIIHVDGWHHFYMEDRIRKDGLIDNWCWRKGWLFIRLPVQDIQKRPKWCRNMIRRLVQKLIIPVIPELHKSMKSKL